MAPEKSVIGTMAEETVRLYNMEDEVMIQRAKVQQGLLATDLLLFTAKFPWIDDAFVTSYLADIDTADAFPEDNTVMVNIAVLTADVSTSMKEGINALKMLFLYSEIAYAKDKVKQRMFGQDRMEKARKDQEKMESLLEHANSMANSEPFKTDLSGNGYTQLQIDALKTISDNISTKKTLQESAKANRPVTTKERVKVMNAVFDDRMRLIATCAQVVFFGDQAKIIQYRAYPPAIGAATKANVDEVNPSNQNMADLTVSIEGIDCVSNAAGMAGPFESGTSPPDNVDVTIPAIVCAPTYNSFTPLLVSDVRNVHGDASLLIKNQ